MIYLLGILAATAAEAHGPVCVTKSVCARVVAQCRSHQLAEPRRWLFVAVAALQEEAELSCRTDSGAAYTEKAVLDEIPVESAVWRNEADAISDCGETLALELGSRKACQ
jgi:hypothetical protein